MTSTPAPETPTLAQWAERLGGVPISRIVTNPPPGNATLKDIAAQIERNDVACELIEGVLVQKAMGIRKSTVIVALARLLGKFVEEGKIGELGIEPGMVLLRPDLILIPDICVYLKPEGGVPATGPRVPDLAVGILSIANTRREIELHRDYLFAAGTRRFWSIDSSSLTLAVHAPNRPVAVLKISDTLAAPDLLPGFQLKVSDLFSPLDRHPSSGR